MQLKNKVLGVVGAMALAVSGIAAPAVIAGTPTDDQDLSISVVCSEYNSVEISGDGEFYDIDLATGNFTSSTINPLLVTVDVGCYFEAWHVDAEVSAFVDFPAFFPGYWFSLDAVPGSETSTLDDSLVTAQDSDFDPDGLLGLGGASQNEIFGTTNLISFPGFLFLPPFELDAVAPFVSTAQFYGALELETLVLTGDYEAELTVTLVKDPNPDIG